MTWIDALGDPNCPNCHGSGEIKTHYADTGEPAPPVQCDCWWIRRLPEPERIKFNRGAY